MLQTVATAPVVSMFVACAYCPALTSFSCLKCSSPMCPDCCPSDLCPECQPAPFAPLMGWSFADEGVEDDAIAVVCAGCGDRFFTEDADDASCAACTTPAAELAALRMVPVPDRPGCQFCGNPIYGTDADTAGTRHACAPAS